MYQVIILPKAINDLSKIDKPSAQRITDKIEWLSENIDNIPLIPLKGMLSGFYKLRIGDWRAIYEVDYLKRVITLHKVGHRKEIYKV
ncbi:MAG: type II toxin-antitoxin system RelE/ParE family toxin [Deltaproteobacteria bacterium]|nr:type II toxin-antitoxin system RelE/ParE family toxin [Deltaproteobacteria bacterium]